MNGWVWALTACLALGAAPAIAEPVAPADVAVRVGNHPGFSRVVFDLPAGVTVETAAEGSRLLLVFSGTERLALPRVTPRNVASVQSDGATITLTMQPGAKPRLIRLGSKLVVDVADPASRAETPVQPRSTAATAGATANNAGGGEQTGRPEKPNRGAAQTTAGSHRRDLEPTKTPSIPDPPSPHAVSAPEPSTAGVASPRDPTETAHADDHAATSAQTPPGHTPTIASEADVAPAKVQPGALAAGEQSRTGETSILLPADATVGAAAFRREDMAVVVLDRRMSLSQPPGWPGAVIVPGPVTTTLLLPLARDRQLRLRRLSAGWDVSVGNASPAGSAGIEPRPEGVLFHMSRQGRPVGIVDPVSGGTLLIGTSLTDGPENAVGTERRAPEFVLLASWLGVVVEPLSDREELRPTQGGFLLRGGTSIREPATVSADHLFDLPDESTPALLNRLNLQLLSAAQAPPRARTAPRLAAAQAMLALGLGVEAHAVLSQAAADDPPAAADVRLPTLAAVAAVQAGRLDEADALDDPRVHDSAEASLWRGIRDRRLERDTVAARSLPAYASLARSYPAPLRDAIWPDLAEAAVEAGAAIPLDQLTPYAAALLLERQGKIDDALVAWHGLAQAPDRLASLRASRHATELDLASGHLSADKASDQLEALATSWRGDGQELKLLLRAAELRGAAGHWRAALDLLRATDTRFPGAQEAIRHAKTAVFEAMLAAEGAGMSPMDVIMLASDFADCVPDNASGAKLAALLADKLMTLDLSARAVPVLQGLVRATAPGAARAEFGTRLAQLLLEAGDDRGASAALLASDAPSLPEEVRQARSILAARALAAGGDVRAAVESLSRMATAQADDVRASLLAKSGDWAGALAALSDLATKSIPATGPLDPAAQAIVVRQATAAVQASDTATLRDLQRQIPRMVGAQADILRVLTEAPVTSTRELPRAATELALARDMSRQIQAIMKR